MRYFVGGGGPSWYDKRNWSRRRDGPGGADPPGPGVGASFAGERAQEAINRFFCAPAPAPERRRRVATLRRGSGGERPPLRAGFSLFAFVLAAFAVLMALDGHRPQVRVGRYGVISGASSITASVAGGNWNTNAAWVGSVQPTSADDVLITATSAGVTIPAATTVVARSLDITAGKLTFAATTSVLNLGDASGGAFTASNTSTLTLTGVGVINFVSTSDNSTAGWNVTTGGRTMPSCTFSGAGGKWVFQDAFTNGATAVVTHTGGALYTNGQTCSWGSYSSSGATVKELNWGASAISMTLGGNAVAWTTGGSNLTLTPGTGSLTFTRNGFTHGPNNPFSGSYPATTFAGGASAATMTIAGTGSPTFASWTLTGVNKADGWSVATGLNPQITGALTATGSTAVNRARLISGTIGTAATITGSIGTLSNVSFRDVTASGGTPWSGTSLGDLGGNTNITFTAGITRYWVVASGTGTGSQSSTTRWATLSGGAGGATAPMLPQDTMVFDGSSFNGAGQTVTMDAIDLGAIDFSLVTNNPNLAFSTAANFYAAVTLKAGMAFTGTAVGLTLIGTGSYTLNLAGVSYDLGNVTLAARPGSTWTLGGDFTTGATRTLTVTTGGFSSAGYAVSVGLVASTGALSRSVTLGASVWSLTGTGSAWNVAASLTLSAASGTLQITDTSGTAKTFAGAGLAYGTFKHVATGAAALTVTGSNTFVALDLECTTARTVTLTAGTTQTVTGALTLLGAAGQNLSIRSSATPTEYTITLGGGATQNIQYADFMDATGTGGPLNDLHGVNSGNNTGVAFPTLIVPPPQARNVLLRM